VAKETDVNTQQQKTEGGQARAEAAKKKEPPAFAWKLTGYSDGLTLTLLKCVDPKDAESQLERLQQEGRYKGLLISPIDAPVPPPPDARKWEPPKPVSVPRQERRPWVKAPVPKGPKVEPAKVQAAARPAVATKKKATRPVAPKPARKAAKAKPKTTDKARKAGKTTAARKKK
jgi:hypothetical protein